MTVGADPRFSVSEFVAIFNQSLDMLFPQVIVVGEISNFRVSKGKWVYFDLKDEYSSVKFFGSVYNLPGPLEDGITCEVYGHPRLHNQFGFSISFERIRPVGEGAIRKAQDLLLQKLEKEGLFAPERKRVLPYPPERIGLVTSAESAAIADFRKIIAARWPQLEIQLIDTLVQGAQAPAAIVAAIQQFNAMSLPHELIVIIRGGGSADDLAAFSEESVVRAVAASRLPTLVAIGHENDVSLAELAADVRASTPSNAAELLVPDIKHERQITQNTRSQLHQALRRHFEGESLYVDHGHKELADLLKRIIRHNQNELLNKRILINALNPLKPLEQGYALVRNVAEKQVRKASELHINELFSIQFTDGKKQFKITKGE